MCVLKVLESFKKICKAKVFKKDSKKTFKIRMPIASGRYKLGLFGTLKLALELQFIVTNAYFSVARTLTLVLHATLQ